MARFLLCNTILFSCSVTRIGTTSGLIGRCGGTDPQSNVPRRTRSGQANIGCTAYSSYHDTSQDRRHNRQYQRSSTYQYEANNARDAHRQAYSLPYRQYKSQEYYHADASPRQNNGRSKCPTTFCISCKFKKPKSSYPCNGA